MQPIRLAAFQGCNLALHDKLLPDTVGKMATNQKPGRGDLRPWKVPLSVATVASGTKTLYRFNRDTASDTNYWFAWSTVVHAVRGFIADDTTERTYYTGDGVPKVTDNVLGIAGAPYPTAARILGIPAPVTAPTLSETTPGTGDDEDRYYVYTYVSDFGEESAPSPVSSLVVCKPGAQFDITALASPPAGAYGIDRIRIYRTQTGQSTSEFYLISEIAVATSSTDNGLVVTATVLATNGPSGTTGRVWLIPPTDLKCLTGLWNGMMAGITGKSVRYCEPNRPYAWPAAYETLCMSTPVALAALDKTLLVLTTGKPRIVYGSAPEAMDDAELALDAACVSVRSVVSTGTWACWATAKGLACYSAAKGPRIATAGLALPEDWEALEPSTMVGCHYDGLYFGFYDLGSGTLKGFMLDPENPSGLVFFDTGYSAAYHDPLQEAMFVLDGTSVKKWDAGATFMTATWKSKVFRLPEPDNPAVAEVIADAYPVTFKLYADGALKDTITVDSRDTFTLSSGYLADDLQIELSAATPITGAVVAGSIDDIKQT